jgi:GLPGLI family protein
MKYRLIVATICLFFTLQVSCQVINGLVSYSVMVGEDELFSQLDKKMRDDYINDLESEKYALEFDDMKSVFYYEGGLSIDGKPKSPKIYFREKDSLYSLRPENDVDFGDIIIVEDRNTKWDLLNESKLIDGYLCFKATSTLVRNNGEAGIFKFPIIAWYAPSIPAPYGPLGYGNLPGLILELQERNILYGVTNIKLNNKIDMKNSKLIKPTVGKRITTEELSSKIAEMFKSR